MIALPPRWFAAAFLTAVLLAGCGHSSGPTASSQTEALSPVGIWEWREGTQFNTEYALTVQPSAAGFTADFRIERLTDEPTELRRTKIFESTATNVAFKDGIFTFTVGWGNIEAVYAGKLEAQRMRGTIIRKVMPHLPPPRGRGAVQGETRDEWRATRAK